MGVDYVFESRPRDGGTVSVAAGIEWLRMPLPFSLNHINLWLLRDGSSWTVVDTGIASDTTKELWQGVFSNSMHGDPVSRVIATHLHPDHVGCAGYLAHHFDVDVWMARDEYMLCRILVADTGREAPDEGVRFYRDAGFSDEQLANYRQAFGMFGRMVDPLPESYKRLSDGDELSIGSRQWRVLTGGGHSPEHVCLYDPAENILIAGDQLLPTISSNISVWPTEPLADPLKDWFATLTRLRASIDEDVLVLPAHGKPFRGAHLRIDAIIGEHEEKLQSLREICATPQRAVDTFPTLFKTRIDDRNRIMATGEALAHLHYLQYQGELKAERRDTAIWYSQS